MTTHFTLNANQPAMLSSENTMDVLQGTPGGKLTGCALSKMKRVKLLGSSSMPGGWGQQICFSAWLPPAAFLKHLKAKVLGSQLATNGAHAFKLTWPCGEVRSPWDPPIPAPSEISLALPAVSYAASPVRSLDFK